jgi:FG-GAP-like repeat
MRPGSTVERADSADLHMITAVGPLLRISSPDTVWGPLLLLLLASLAVLAWPARASGADAPPFTNRPHEGLTGVLQAWPLHVSDCPGNEADLLVVSVQGGPPTQQKFITWMPCGSAVRPGDPAIIRRELGPEVALVDVARVPNRSGAQLLLLSADGIRVESLDRSTTEPALEFSVPGGLPLPIRPRQLSRIEIFGDWHSNGRPVALVPGSSGGRLVDLSNGEIKRLPMPIFASYRSWDPFLPRTIWNWVIAETRWPTLARADDNGDGRLDLFALSRWEIWIYHTGPDGLPAEPSRKLETVPFDEKIERRHEATALTYFARDINDDSRADIVLSTVGGGLMAGRSTTEVHINPGTGVSIGDSPAAKRETKGGFSDINLIDLDGDGSNEIVEMSLEFGVLQAVGVLLTGKMDVVVRVMRLDPEEQEGLATEFEDELSFRVDLGSSSIEGLVPTLGDWNGDGIQDLYASKGSDAISFWLGSAPGDGPRFGRPKGRQPLPLASGEARIADLDGDGLDDIVAFDHAETEAHLVVLHNRGVLPGTSPTLRAAD